ncbi:nucleoside monophosphate kinase [Streptomyces sp. NPDC048253]|uniref:nucleoside monophosphate kinase n=1 Tax=Streptomyces sp. NPDC048253 TaxID=3365524 RepID=UPI00371E4755
MNFTLELVRQLAGSDQDLREQWRERWKRVKLQQRQLAGQRKSLESRRGASRDLRRDLLDATPEPLSAAQREAERIIQAAQAEAESIIESARIRADEMTESASQMLLNATERGTMPAAAARLLLREHSRIVLVGPPGSGKGTQSPFLSKLLEIPVVNVGQMFRTNISARTKLGKRAYDFMHRGELIPDNLMLEMLADTLRSTDTGHGFLLDGMPRNLAQAELVEDLLTSTSGGIDAVLNFDVGRDEVFRRLVGRRICKNDSSHVAHIMYAAPLKYGTCDVCGGPLYLRDDDTRKVIGLRLEVWKSQSEPVVKKYGAEGRLVTISGIGTVPSVTERAVTALNAYFG